jgi:lambda family phage portal protein
MPYGQPNWGKFRGGIEFDDYGAPIAYHIRNAHQSDWYMSQQTMTWTRIERTTAWGRPQFVHAFEPDREGQSRGMTPFAALVVRLRMIGRFADTELASATVNALFAAFVKSNLPVHEVAQSLAPGAAIKAGQQDPWWLRSRADYHEKNRVQLGGVRIPVLPIGDEITINSNPRQTGAFTQFQTAFLRSISAAIGISYEQLSMDWSQTNYSSARAALNEVWRHISAMLSGFTDQVVTPIYAAWLEEAFDRSYIVPPPGAPDFWDMPGAYVSSRWIGPPRGYVDPVKEAQAAAMRMDSLVSTLQKECAEQGVDYEETLDQIASEQDEMASRGIERRAVLRGEGDPQPESVPENAATTAPAGPAVRP